MDRIPGLIKLLEKAPELATPRGLLRAAATLLAVFLIALLALLYVEARWQFVAFLLQLAIYAINYRLVEQVIQGRSHRRPYNQVFFNRFIPATGLNLASMGYVLFAGRGYFAPSGAAPDETIRLVPFVVGVVVAIYLLVTALLLVFRSIQMAGVDTLAVVYSYFPNEGRRLSGGVYNLLRHPAYAGLDRIALGFAFLNGTSYSLLLASLFVFVWHPVWIRIEEEELAERFGGEYDKYRRSVPAVVPSSLKLELAMVEAITRQPPVAADTETQGTSD